jgi:hypothetical protein
MNNNVTTINNFNNVMGNACTDFFLQAQANNLKLFYTEIILNPNIVKEMMIKEIFLPSELELLENYAFQINLIDNSEMEKYRKKIISYLLNKINYLIGYKINFIEYSYVTIDYNKKSNNNNTELFSPKIKILLAAKLLLGEQKLYNINLNSEFFFEFKQNSLFLPVTLILAEKNIENNDNILSYHLKINSKNNKQLISCLWEDHDWQNHGFFLYAIRYKLRHPLIHLAMEVSELPELMLIHQKKDLITVKEKENGSTANQIYYYGNAIEYNQIGDSIFPKLNTAEKQKKIAQFNAISFTKNKDVKLYPFPVFINLLKLTIEFYWFYFSDKFVNHKNDLNIANNLINNDYEYDFDYLYIQFTNNNFKLLLSESLVDKFIEELFYITYNILPLRFPEQFNIVKFNQLFVEQEINIKNKLANITYLELYLPVKIINNDNKTTFLYFNTSEFKKKYTLDASANNLGLIIKFSTNTIYELLQKLEKLFPNFKTVVFVTTFYFVFLRLIASFLLFSFYNPQFMVVRELKIVVFGYLILITIAAFMPTKFISTSITIIKYFLFPFYNSQTNLHFIKKIQKWWFFTWSLIMYFTKQILSFHFFVPIFFIFICVHTGSQILFILFYFSIFLKVSTYFLSILFDQQNSLEGNLIIYQNELDNDIEIKELLLNSNVTTNEINSLFNNVTFKFFKLRLFTSLFFKFLNLLLFKKIGLKKESFFSEQSYFFTSRILLHYKQNMYFLYHYLEVALDYQIKKEETMLIEAVYFIKFIYYCFIVTIIIFFLFLNLY